MVTKIKKQIESQTESSIKDVTVNNSPLAEKFLTQSHYLSGMVYTLEKILDLNDIYESKERMILKKSGVRKLLNNFNLKLIKWDMKCLPDAVYLMCEFYNETNNVSIKECGEATELNTDGLGSKFLLATALKRVEARAIIRYLDLDAWSEDESPDFFLQKSGKGNLPEINKELLEKTVKELSPEIVSKYLKENILIVLGKLNLPTDRESITKLCSYILKTDITDTKYLTHSSLLSILAALNIRERLGTDAFEDYCAGLPGQE